jgi:REP element-mobilizing transposase RayT
MGRRARQHYEGAVYHAMSRGNDKQAIFLDQQDYQRFLKDLARAVKFVGAELYAFCLMPNHFHLLVRVGHLPLEKLMLYLKTRYANGFNRKWNRIGHLFEGRYKSLLCANDAYFKQLIRYIHLNPVKANLVASPGDWPGSSHNEYLGLESGITETAYPLSLFDPDSEKAREIYLDLLGLGPTAFPMPEESDSPAPHPIRPVLAAKRGLRGIALTACRRARITLPLLRSRSRCRSLHQARRQFILDSLEAGFGPSEIAAFMGRTPGVVSNAIRAAESSSKVDTIPPIEN